MTEAHRRPKTPDQTRRALLDAAAALVLQQGLAALPLPAICAAAGVTKGAIFHHFGSRAGLIEALSGDLIDRIDQEIEAALSCDPGGHGHFTRAYVSCIFAPAGAASPWATLSLAALGDSGLAQLWTGWMADRLARHADTDAGLMLELVRLAADGHWLARAQGAPLAAPPEKLRDRLIALTHQAPSQTATPLYAERHNVADL